MSLHLTFMYLRSILRFKYFFIPFSVSNGNYIFMIYLLMTSNAVSGKPMISASGESLVWDRQAAILVVVGRRVRDAVTYQRQSARAKQQQACRRRARAQPAAQRGPETPQWPADRGCG